MSQLSSTRSRAASWSPIQWTLVVLLVAVVVFAGVAVRNVARAGEPAYRVPQSAAVEAASGIRVSRVAVVGDGGLITVSYVALDVEKAARFQADASLRPTLESEAREGGTKRVSLMRQGHNLRAGQTYYFVYQNSGGAIRPRERVTVVVGDVRLEHVPVL